MSICFLKLTYFITKKLYGHLLIQQSNTTTPRSGSLKFKMEGIQLKTFVPQEILLTSLYLQKLLKYLHLTNLTDINLTPLSDIDLTYIYFYSLPYQNIENITYTLFFNNRFKYSLRNNTLKQFFDKDKFYCRCFSETKINLNHTLEVQSLLFQSFDFLKQKEFQLMLKKNLDLSRENR
jgi:hypothetical protein